MSSIFGSAKVDDEGAYSNDSSSAQSVSKKKPKASHPPSSLGEVKESHIAEVQDMKKCKKVDIMKRN